MDFVEEKKVKICFIIPCGGSIFAYKNGNGDVYGTLSDRPFQMGLITSFYETLIIISKDQNKSLGFINQYTFDYGGVDYSYIEEKSKKPLRPQYLFDRLNETHIRFYIEEIFSDAPEIN